MIDTKIVMNIVLPGSTLFTETSPERAPENYKKNTVSFRSKRDEKRTVVTFYTRKAIPAFQRINIGIDAYKYFISNTEIPKEIKKGIWLNMTKEARVLHHLNNIAESLGGSLVDYEIFED